MTGLSRRLLGYLALPRSLLQIASDGGFVVRTTRHRADSEKGDETTEFDEQAGGDSDQAGLDHGGPQRLTSDSVKRDAYEDQTDHPADVAYTLIQLDGDVVTTIRRGFSEDHDLCREHWDRVNLALEPIRTLRRFFRILRTYGLPIQILANVAIYYGNYAEILYSWQTWALQGPLVLLMFFAKHLLFSFLRFYFSCSVRQWTFAHLGNRLRRVFSLQAARQ